MMRTMIRVVVLSVLAVLLLPCFLYAQQKDNFGKEFYIAFGENQGAGEQENLFVLYITSETAASGIVDIPHLGFNRKFTTTPGQITTIELPNGDGAGTVELQEWEAGQVLRDYAVHVTADNEIAVYGLNHKQFSTDAFMAIPVDVLGTEYLTINYPSSNNGSFNVAATPGEFWIVAPFDSTNVTITPKDNTSNGVSSTNPVKIRMYKGDVYLMQGIETDVSNDLTGSLIESDQPIAVFSGHVRAAIPRDFKNKGSNSTSRDHLVEQLPPVSAWGDSALVVPYRSSSLPDLVRIVSAEDENIITVNGNQVATLNKGEFFEIKQLSGPTSINATNPIMVGQYSHTSVYGTAGGGGQPYGDPAYALVYPVEQFHTSYTFVSVPLDAYLGGDFVNVVADASSIANITLDGKLLPSSIFSPIPNSGYYYAQIRLDDKNLTPNGQGTHNISGPKPFGITVYGLGPVDSYSYSGGTLLKTITPFKTTGLLIDFGDRLLTTLDTDPKKSDQYTDTFDSVVALQNISSDPLTITGFPTRSSDDTCFWVVSPTSDLTIGPGESKFITIRFKAFHPDIRRHTILNAKTEHLRAYVVDVYGRGILGNPQVFSDSIIKKHIDTLDFGTFENTDPPKDSMVYIANKGAAPLEIKNATLMNYKGPGVGTAEFSITSFDTAQMPVTIPFILPLTSKTPARMNLRFNPTGAPNGYREQVVDVEPTSGGHRQVYLVARVLTIAKPTVQMAAPFDSVLLCTERDRTITITNSNDFEIKVTDLTIIGSPDFTIVTPQPPFTVPAKGVRNIIIRFSPSATGAATADITLKCNLPKGFEFTQSISAIGTQLTASFSSSENLRALPNQDVIVPIYAHTPMEVFQSSTFKLIVSYDPTHLEDYDYDQYNTHTAYGAYYVLGDTAGYREYDYQTLDGSIVSGGVAGDSIPVLYIKFHTHLNEGDDPATFYKQYPVTYSFNFDRSPYPTGCADIIQQTGLVTLDSTCANPGLLFPRTDPNNANIESITPNPSAHGSMSMTIAVPKEGPVRLDVLDNLGNIVNTIISESKKPGYYDLRWNTTGVKNGSYFLSLRTQGGTNIRHVVVLH